MVLNEYLHCLTFFSSSRSENATSSPSPSISASGMANTSRVYIPPKYFKYMGETPKGKMVLYKCMMGCEPREDKDGAPKYLSFNANSRYNARRHIKVYITFNYCLFIK